MNFLENDFSKLQTTSLDTLKDKFEDRSLIGDLAYNFNTTTAWVKNTFGNDESLRVPQGPLRNFDLNSKEVDEYMSTMPDNVRSRVDWSSVDSWEKLYAIENRIAEADKGMEHLKERLGTVATIGLGIPFALVDIADAAALYPIGKAYSMVKTASRVGNTIKGLVGGSAFGYASESLYQTAMGINDSDDLLFSTLFGASLLGTAGALTKVRNVHNTVRNEDETETVLSNEEIMNTKVENNQRTLDSLEEDLRTNTEQIQFWKEDVNKNKEFLKKAKVDAREAAKTYNKDTKRFDELQQEIAKQEELSVFDRLRETLDAVNTEADSFFKSREKLIKDREYLVKEQNQLIKARNTYSELKEAIASVNKEIESRLGTKKPIKQLQNRLKKYKDRLAKVEKVGKFTTKAHERKLRELTKTIKDNAQVLKASGRGITDLRNRQGKAKADLEKFLSKTIIKHPTRAKRKDIEALKEELKGINLTAATKKANETDNTLKMFERLVSEKKENLARVKEGKQAIKKKVVEQRDALNTLKRELEEAQKVKADAETLANENEGKLEKVLGFLPYITPKSLLHSSNNAIVRNAALRLFPPSVALKDGNGNLVPTGMSAKEFKNRYEANWTVALHEMYSDYKAAVAEGYNKGEAAYFEEVTQNYVKANSRAMREAEDLGKDTITVNYVNDNKHIQSSMQSVGKYFSKMAEIGNNLGVYGFKNVKPGEGYYRRIVDYSKVDKMGMPAAINYLTRAIMRKNPNKSLEDATTEARNYLKHSEQSNYMRQLVQDGYGQAVDSGVQEARGLDVYDDDILDIMATNVLEVGSAYSYAMSGRFALQKMLGFTQKEDITNFLNDLTANGMTVKERDSMEVLINTLLGTRELMTNPNGFYGKALRMLTKGNFTIYSMGFGITSMVEIANILGTTGLQPVIKGHFGAIESLRSDLTGGKATKKWLNELRAVGLVGDAINSRAIQRYDSIDTINSNGIVEESLDKWNNKLSKYSGLIPLTDALKSIAMGSGYHWMLQVAKQPKVSNADAKRLARMGITAEDLAKLKDIDSKHVTYDADGNLEAFNFEKWDLEFGERIQDAMMRHTESTVLHPDGATLPMWMSDPNSPIAKIMFQFMRFPIAAYEQLSLRGLSEFDAKQSIGIAANMAFFTLLAQIKDLGDDTPRYDLSTTEGQKNIMTYLMTNNYGIGPALTMMERAFTLGTGHQPFSTWNQGSSTLLGISATSTKNAQEAAYALIEGDTQNVIKNMSELSPINSIPFIKHQIDPFLEDIYE